MSDRSVRLTRRRLLGSIATVGVASAATGAGTIAYLSDKESSSGNSLQSGTLDLTLTDQSKNTSVSFLDKSGVVPGDGSSESLLLNNDGSVSADLDVTLNNITSTDKNGKHPGDLENYLEVRGVVELADGSTEEIFNNQTVANLRGTTLSHGNIPIDNGETHKFVLHWDLPQSTTKNKAQGDSVGIGLGFTLTQSGP